MGNGLANFPLPEIATLVLTFTILPLIMSMWFYSTHFMSWALSTALILAWEVAISWAFNVQDPFGNYVEGTQQYNEAIFIFGILVILCLCSSLVGSLVSWILDLADIIPFSAIFPLSRRDSTTVTQAENDNSSATGGIQHFFNVEKTQLVRYGIIGVPAPILHVLVTLVLFAITVMTPHILYAIYMDNTGNHIALGCILAIPFVGYVLCFIFWWFFPSMYVWGPCQRNFKQAGTRYQYWESDSQMDANTEIEQYKRAMREVDTHKAHARITKTLLVIAIAHLVSNAILGLLRYFDPDVNANWIAGACVVGVILIIAFIVAIVLYFTRKPEILGVYPKMTPVPEMDESGNYVMPADASADQTVNGAADASTTTSNNFMNHFNEANPQQKLSQRLHKSFAT